MKHQIKNRYTQTVLWEVEADDLRAAVVAAAKKGANLRGADLQGADLQMADLQRANLQIANLRGADLQGANLQMANLQMADLQGANLQVADLQRADLQGANLQGADIQGAYLQGAYLQRANLQGANGLNKHLITPLRILLEQPGKIHAYKLVQKNGDSPTAQSIGHTPINYKIGETYTVDNPNTDESKDCAAGISLATLDYCLREWEDGYRILIAEFTSEDIAAIPTATDGKFRVRKCAIVGEKNLADLDWPPKAPEKKDDEEKPLSGGGA